MIRQHHGLYGCGVMWCEDTRLISSWTTKPLAENSVFGYWFKVRVLPLERGVLFSHPSLFKMEALAFPFISWRKQCFLFILLWGLNEAMYAKGLWSFWHRYRLPMIIIKMSCFLGETESRTTTGKCGQRYKVSAQRAKGGYARTPVNWDLLEIHLDGDSRPRLPAVSLSTVSMTHS